MPPYQPEPLARIPAGSFTQLVQAAKAGQLVLYFGAGLSMAPPACGPTGATVAESIRPFVARILDVSEAEIAALSLEDLAQRVSDEVPDQLDELRSQAAGAFDFRGIAPNFGHRAAALLLREGVVQLISANWDCGVEQAGIQVNATIQGVASLSESLALANSLPLYKIHGCATQPPTLAITQGDVDSPQGWAVARTQQALVGGVVAFVGLGTVGLYVREPLPELVATWTSQAQTIYVVDPDLSQGWRQALGDDKAEEAHIQRTADAFLDELLRAYVRAALDSSEQLARKLADQESWAEITVTGFTALREALEEATADSVLRWWRDGVVASRDGVPFIADLPGSRCILTVAFLIGSDGGQAELAGGGSRQTVATSQQYFEIVCRPGDHVGHVQTVARDRIEQRHKEGVYPIAKPITAVVVDAFGEFPATAAPIDIAAGDEGSTDIAAGVEAVPIRFVAAEHGVDGRLAA